jgi:hypothetical protein
MIRSRAVQRYALVIAGLLLVKLADRRGALRRPQPGDDRLSPMFLDQVKAGNVADIASTDTGTIQGLFRKRVRISAGSLMGSGGPLGAINRARARRAEGGVRTTFADVAGIDEAKDELAEIVDYLRRPERYRRLGGRVRAACSSRELRGPARRCWRERWPARPAGLDTPTRPSGRAPIPVAA